MISSQVHSTTLPPFRQEYINSGIGVGKVKVGGPGQPGYFEPQDRLSLRICSGSVRLIQPPREAFLNAGRQGRHLRQIRKARVQFVTL